MASFSDPPGWLLDELTTAGRENLDADHVSRYDQKEDADAADEVALLTSLGIDHRSTVVDIGAGTGQFSVAAARVFDRVIAVDVSEVMLRALRAKAAALANLTVVHAGFLTYDHAGLPADVIYSRYALHHLPDFWKSVALHRLHSILCPGGILRLWDVVYNFMPADAKARVEAWCATGSDAVGTGWNRGELEEHIRDEHSTFTWLLEPMIDRSGFTITEAVYSDDAFFAKYVLTKS